MSVLDQPLLLTDACSRRAAQRGAMDELRRTSANAWFLPTGRVWLCREGCSGSIFLSVQYEQCEDIDAIESTRAKVGILFWYPRCYENETGFAQASAHWIHPTMWHIPLLSLEETSCGKTGCEFLAGSSTIPAR